MVGSSGRWSSRARALPKRVHRSRPGHHAGGNRHVRRWWSNSFSWLRYQPTARSVAGIVSDSVGAAASGESASSRLRASYPGVVALSGDGGGPGGGILKPGAIPAVAFAAVRGSEYPPGSYRTDRKKGVPLPGFTYAVSGDRCLAPARIGGAWELRSYDQEAASSGPSGCDVRRSWCHPVACAGPAGGEGLLGGLIAECARRNETDRSLTAIRLIGGGYDVQTMPDTKPKRTRRSFTDEFKAGAVRLVLDEGKTVGAAARDLDLTESSLRNWVEHARADRTKGKTGLTTAEREELARLRKENRILQEERDILKKAAAFFAKQSR